MKSKINNFNIKNILYFLLVIIFTVSIIIIPKITENKFYNLIKSNLFKNLSLKYLILIYTLYKIFPIIIIFLVYFIIIIIKNKNLKFLSLKTAVKKILNFIKYFSIQIMVIISVFFIFKLLKIIDIKFFTYTKETTTKILYSYLWLNIFFVLPMALYEEIIFRKITFDLLKEKFSVILVIITTSLVFALMHFRIYNYFIYQAKDRINIYYKLSNSITDFVFLFIYGVLLSLIKLNTKTIFSCTGFHSGYNLIYFFLNPFFITKTYSDNSFLLLPLFNIKPNFYYPNFIYIFKYQIELFEISGLILILSTIIIFISYLIYTILLMRKSKNMQKNKI